MNMKNDKVEAENYCCCYKIQLRKNKNETLGSILRRLSSSCYAKELKNKKNSLFLFRHLNILWYQKKTHFNKSFSIQPPPPPPLPTTMTMTTLRKVSRDLTVLWELSWVSNAKWFMLLLQKKKAFIIYGISSELWLGITCTFITMLMMK